MRAKIKHCMAATAVALAGAVAVSAGAATTAASTPGAGTYGGHYVYDKSSVAYNPAGSWTVRAGAIWADFATTSSRTTDGFKPRYNSVTSGAASLTWMLADHFGIDLQVNYPYKPTIRLKDRSGTNYKLGTVDVMMPTLLAHYYFADPTSRWQPYIGMGVNYTIFYDTSPSSFAKKNAGAKSFDIDNSWGLTGQVGLDYYFTKNWLVNASVSYSDVSSTLKLKGVDENGTAMKENVRTNLDPWVYRLNIGWTF